MIEAEDDLSRSPDRRANHERRRPRFSRRASDRLQFVARDVDGDQFVVGPFSLDDRQKALLVNGINPHLTPKEYELFTVFLSSAGEVLSASEIMVSLWPSCDRADPADVKQYIYLLRRKIEANPRKPRWIRTVRGFGYQLVLAAGERQKPERRERSNANGKQSAARA